MLCPPLSHNDLAWRIFADDHNVLDRVDLNRGMQGIWNITHTDIPRLLQGQLGAQVKHDLPNFMIIN